MVNYPHPEGVPKPCEYGYMIPYEIEGGLGKLDPQLVAMYRIHSEQCAYCKHVRAVAGESVFKKNPPIPKS